MAIIIPATNDGNREVTVNTGSGVYRFRTYYTQGEMDGWYLDIRDDEGNVLRTGIRIVPGCPNLLKGQGDMFLGVQLACAVASGTETTPTALGEGTFLVWFNPGEANPFVIGDPLIDIAPDEWDFGEPEFEE